MADLCNKCAPEMWGPETPADIDILQIVENLEYDTYVPCICEGCGLLGIGKDEDGNPQLAVLDSTRERTVKGIPVNWMSYEEFMALPLKN
jgi:hypothetical protein